MDASTVARSGIGELSDAPEAFSSAFDSPDALDSGNTLAPRVAELSQQLAEIVTELTSDSAIGRVSGREAISAAAAVEHLSRLVQAAQVVLAARIADDTDRPLGAPRLTDEFGCATPVELLQRITRAPARTITGRLRLAERILPSIAMTGDRIDAETPLIGEAILTGQLSAESGELISRTLAHCERHASTDALEIAERELVNAATGESGALPEHHDSLRTMCQVWQAFLNQDGTEPTETVPEYQRSLNLVKTPNGLVRITGSLLPETGAALGRLLDAMNAPSALRRRGPVRFVSDAKADPSEAPSLGEAMNLGEAASLGNAADTYVAEADMRTADQKRHDAFATVLERMVTSPEVPQLGGAPVTVMVQVEKDALDNREGIGWVHGFDGAPAPVPLSFVRRAVCTGATQRILQDEGGAIIELGTVQRVFNAHQRRAIMVRDGGCIIPGCTIPATWCEIHHVTEHQNGGATHTDNGVLLCWYHHRSIDTNGWQIRIRDGVPEVKPPGWYDALSGWRPARPPLKPPGLTRTG